MNGSERCARITRVLSDMFQPQSLRLDDESHLHRGHAGALTGKGHFKLRIVADAFRGKTPLARHRMIYDALSALLDSDIHALSIEALSPDEAAH